MVGLLDCPVVVPDTVLEWDNCEERSDGHAEVVLAVTQRRVTATVTTAVVRKSPDSAVTSEEYKTARTRPVLIVTSDEWAAFAAGLNNGEFP